MAGTLRVSYLPTLTGEHQATQVADFRALAEYFERVAATEYPSKASVPLLSPCTFVTEGRHLQQDADTVTCAVLDADKLTPEQVEALFDALEPYNYVAHTTWSHDAPEKQCFRVWLETDRPIPAESWKKGVFPHLLQAFPSIDPKCKNPNRFYHLPSNGAGVFSSTEGKPFGVPTTPARADVDAPKHDIAKADLRRLAKSLESSQSHKRKAFGTILAHVLDGVAYARDGERDDLTFRLCFYIAERFPNADPQGIAKHFEQSLSLMGPDALSVEDVAAKLERQQERVREESERRASELEDARSFDISRAFGDPERKHPYTTEELEAIADKHRTTPEQLRKQWVVQRGEHYWILTPKGYATYGRADAALAASVELSPAPVSTFEMGGTAQNPRIEVKPIARMVSEFGSVAQEVSAHLNLPVTYFSSATKTLHEACAPLAQVPPLSVHEADYYHVKNWLTAMAGSNAPILEKWMYWVTTLDSPCAALFLTGSPGAGKSLLASGLAKLWGHVDPTPLEALMASFNDAVTRCPLVFADESLPKDYKGNVRSEELRELIQARSRPLRRKFRPDTTLHGAIRLMIAGNNEELLQFKERHLTDNDIHAISERIVHIHALEDGTDYLKSLPPGQVHRWVNEGTIARYAVAMQEKYPDLAPEGRFLVRQESDYVYRSIVANSEAKYGLLRWLHDIILNPQLVMTQPELHKHIHVSDRGVYVHFKAVEQTWQTFSKEPMPHVRSVSRELSSLGGRAKMPETGINAYKLNLRHLYAWVERDGSCTVEEMKERIERGVDFCTPNNVMRLQN